MRSKGRKHRATPLIPETIAVLRTGSQSATASPRTRCSQPAGPAAQPRRRQQLLAKHATAAAARCPSLEQQASHPAHRSGTPPRCSCKPAASTSRRSRSGSATTSIQTTRIYQHADPALKQQAIDRTAPLGTKPGRYRPADTLLAFLDSL